MSKVIQFAMMMRQRVSQQSEEQAQTSVPEDTLRSLNLCPDDDSSVESDSDYESDYE